MRLLKKQFKVFSLLFNLLIIFTISACSSPDIKNYNNTKPDFNVLHFFNGELEAKGVVMDRKGLVTRRFSVIMLGNISKSNALDKEQLTLEEWFTFDDGEQSKRTWIITKNDDGTYQGRANDIIDVASGESLGMALHWDYEMDLTVEGTTYRVVFDDWLYRIDDHNVINRSYIKKWGFKVGEVILSIRKIK
ncbi:DUF3833 domain-containing protein [Psychromonas sp. KJ10-10]|uniref:DUF3833 domain-containing protein n=1 Tax=Psychromonas sp. KJ10-10 TaxID=3391823 RepID=UPI0039B55C8B